MDQYFLAEVNPVRLGPLIKLPRTYAIKISGTMPQFFPQSAYSCQTLQELLDKIPWKESRDIRKFIVCFEEHKVEELDKDTSTPTPKVTPRKVKPLPYHRSRIRIKEEPQVKIEGASSRRSKKRDVVDKDAGIDTLDLTLDNLLDLQLPTRKRSLSYIEDPQSTRTSPTQASVTSTQDSVPGVESPASIGILDPTPIKNPSLRYPQRVNRKLKRAFDDVPRV